MRDDLDPGSSETAPAEHDKGRERFAAGALELEAVLAIVARFAPSSLGRRVLDRLGPREASDARSTLARVREMQALQRANEVPSWAGVSDPLPSGAGGGERTFDERRFLDLRAFLEATGRVREWFGERQEEVPELCAVAAELPNLSALAGRIDRVLDSRGQVRSDASDLLARLAAEVARLSGAIDKKLRELLGRNDVRNVLSDGSVHRRGGRPVLAVKAKSAGRVPGLVHDRSQSEQSIFIEPREVVEPGNRLAAARADERREIDRILLELSRAVHDEMPAIEAAAAGMGEIELAMTSARFAAECDARAAPQPGDEGASEGLLLRGARHPLLIEQQVRGAIDEVVPIDLRLGVDFDMLIITGPNTGGKTLALKTAGLFALMTRAGLPVPAQEGSTVPLYDGIAADIGDEQEISQNLSTFASHVARIRSGLERAGPRTLFLLDELGGGTDPAEGAALGEALLVTLLDRGVPTIVSTHIGKLKEFAFRHERAENACTEFDLATLAPRFHLLLGTPGESGALVIARRLGIPAEVIELAEQRVERREGEVVELMNDVRTARVDAERARSQAEDQLQDARDHRRQLAEQQAELNQRGDRLEKEAERGLEERVRGAMREIREARALIDQLPAEVAGHMAERLARLEAELTGAALTDRRQAFFDGLGKGSLVYLPRYRQRVIVQRISRAKRTVTVQLGKMRMNVSFDEVTHYESL